MKRLFLILIFSALTLFAGVESLSIPQFESYAKNGMPVIDIRTQGEWKQTGIIPGSHTITFFRPDGSYDIRDFVQRLQALGIDKKTPFILVCRSANRTRTLGNYLADELGYRVYDLRGGINNWRAHGKPLIPYKAR
jgi:rhodanese-related sulfurtransferase